MTLLDRVKEIRKVIQDDVRRHRGALMDERPPEWLRDETIRRIAAAQMMELARFDEMLGIIMEGSSDG